MRRNRRQAGVKSGRRHMLSAFELVANPEHTVAGDTRVIRKAS